MKRSVTAQRRGELRDALSGPVVSIRTPFPRDGTIDYGGLRRYVDFCVEAGSRSLILTFGDSLFLLLNEHEIAEVTSVVLEQTRGRATICGATGMWSTAQSVEYAEYCRTLGIDLVMVLPPNWAMSRGVDELVDHYEAAVIISSKESPLFNHLLACPGGFDAGLHGIYELVGIYGRWRRRPYRLLSDQDMEILEDVCKTHSILR